MLKRRVSYHVHVRVSFPHHQLLLYMCYRPPAVFEDERPRTSAIGLWHKQAEARISAFQRSSHGRKFDTSCWNLAGHVRLHVKSCRLGGESCKQTWSVVSHAPMCAYAFALWKYNYYKVQSVDIRRKYTPRALVFARQGGDGGGAAEERPATLMLGVTKTWECANDLEWPLSHLFIYLAFRWQTQPLR